MAVLKLLVFVFVLLTWCQAQLCSSFYETSCPNALSTIRTSFRNAIARDRSLGQAQCVTFRDRIYTNGSHIDAGFASTRRRGCPRSGGEGDLVALDLLTPNSFDNNYFKNLIQKKGLLESDQVLFSGGSTDSIVLEYSRSPSTFSFDFATDMVKMGNLINPNANQILSFVI